MNKLKENMNEILFAYYVFSFVLLGRIVPNYTQISTIVLLSNVVCILAISFIYNKFKMKFTIQEIIMYFVIILYAIIDYSFRLNEFTIQTYVYMIIFAIIPMYLFLRIKKINTFLTMYSIFSILIALLFILDPFQEYKYSSDYMGFGYNVMMLAYIGIYIMERKKKRVLLKILLLVVLIEMLLFSNKGAILAIGLFTLLYELLINKGTTKKIFLIVICLILLLSAKMIVIQIHDIAERNGIHSYSIETLYQFVNKTSSGLSGREDIWKKAQGQIESNILLGNGAGHFRTTNTEGMYTHNVVFDILIEYGIVVFIVLSILIIKGIIKIGKVDKADQLLGIVFLCMWFPKLFFSSYFQSDMGFWLFLIWGLQNIKLQQGEKDESKKFNY